MRTKELAFLFESSPSLQLIRMRNADWVLPFLHAAFKSTEKLSIPESRLASTLADALRSRADLEEDPEEAARKYLSTWVQRRLLQDFSDPEGHTHYQLSAHAEKVFQWLQSLQKRQFVGTESRFRMLFSSLRDIVEKTEDDRTRRLEELKNKKADIDKEIRALKAGAPVEV